MTDEYPPTCAFFSDKGGVGKSSAVTGVAAAAAKRGLNVVGVDCDPRGTVTDEFGIKLTPGMLTLNDLLALPDDGSLALDPAEVVEQVLQPAGSGWPVNVRVMPGERRLGNREMDGRPFTGRLRRALQGLAGRADLVLIDPPPRPGGPLMTTVLVAADRIIIPSTLTTDGYDGVLHSLMSLKNLVTSGVAAPHLIGILRTIVPRPNNYRGVHDDWNQALLKLQDSDVQARLNLLGIQDIGVLPMKLVDYSVREEVRGAGVPITAAPGREARILEETYDEILDCILANRIVVPGRVVERG